MLAEVVGRSTPEGWFPPAGGLPGGLLAGPHTFLPQ